MSEHLEGLNLVELLDALEPVPEPLPIPLTPQTAGWLWLAAAVIAVVALLVIRHIKTRRANAYRRAALKELTQAQDDATRIALLLRRTALAAYPRRRVAGLIGSDWLEFLDQSFAGTGFRDGPGQLLTTAPYQGKAADPALTTLARRWIETHRVEER